MDAKNLLATIEKIKIDIESIQAEIAKIERQKQIDESARNFEVQDKKNKMRTANIMREAFSHFKKGLTAWEVAEKIAGYFPSVWDAYYFISKDKRQENIRYQFARAYLVSTLAKNGMTYSEIAKIAGCTRARCCQIAHTFKN